VTEPLPVLPTIDKRGRSVIEMPEEDQTRRLSEVGRKAIAQLEAHAIAQVTDAGARKVVTVHSRYGKPPGELAYVHSDDWTPAMHAEAAEWLRNEQSKEWWAAQGQAQHG